MIFQQLVKWFVSAMVEAILIVTNTNNYTDFYNLHVYYNLMILLHCTVHIDSMICSQYERVHTFKDCTDYAHNNCEPMIIQ